MIRRLIVIVSILVLCAGAYAQAQTEPTPSMCTTTVQLPPAPARGGQPGGAGGRGGGAQQGGQPAQAAATPTDLPRLVKLKDDVYVIKNVNDTVAEIGPFGGNVTIYLTNDGVILFDSKNDRMHDDIVAKVRSLTDKPIKYVILTHNHADHVSGHGRLAAATGARIHIHSIESY